MEEEKNKANQPQEGLFKVETVMQKKKAIFIREIVEIKDINLVAGYENEDYMLNSIEDIGLVDDNIILLPKGKKYEVVDGKRRIMSLKKAGETTVSAIILKEETTPVQAAMLTLLKNNARTHNYIAELEALEILQKNNVKSSVIAKHLNVSKATVNMLLKLLTLPDPLYKALKKNKITIVVAKEAVKLSDKMKAKAVKIYEDSGALTTTDIASLRAKEKEAITTVIPDKIFETETIGLGGRGGGKTSILVLRKAIQECQSILGSYILPDSKRTAEGVIKEILSILDDKKIVELTK